MIVSSKRRPVAGAVVIGAIDPELRSRLAEAVPGTWRQDAARADVFVLSGVKGPPRAIVEKIADMVADKGIVLPMLADGEGHKLQPTGVVQTRWRERPGEAELVDLAARHRLRLVGVNRWNTRQVSFGLLPGERRSLATVEKTLETEPGIEAVWSDTRAAYARGN